MRLGKIFDNATRRIEALEEQVRDLQKAVREMSEYQNTFMLGGNPPEHNLVAIHHHEIRAIREYLDLDISWHLETDPAYEAPAPRKIRVWKAYKRLKVNKKTS